MAIIGIDFGDATAASPLKSCLTSGGFWTTNETLAAGVAATRLSPFTMHELTQAPRLILQSAVPLVLLLVIAGLTQAQTITGRWEWHEVAVKNQPQTRFSLMITRKANVVRGVYSVDEFINCEWQGEDGNQTPFLGVVKGKNITLQFDPLATVPGYQQNVNYRAPHDGPQPSIARLVLSGRTLRWQIISGAGIEGLPNKLALRRPLHQ